MFGVEVLTVSPKLIGPIGLAMQALNGLQSEFHFAFPSTELLAQAEVMQRNRYTTAELFSWLRQYREIAKGHRPQLILIVDGYLSSANLSNLFGSHEAERGLAVFTTHDSGRFVHDLTRYIRYYLVRYSLSFLAPAMKSHLETRGCFFDKKINKTDLALSISTGGICDICRSQLTACWTASIKRAIEDMARLIAEDYPRALVMKGGGVKGLAFAGAMLELGDYFSFDVFAGTSAGSIAALLFAAGYSPRELRDELSRLDFRGFRDASLPGSLLNFIRWRGLYPGDALRKWMDARLTSKIGAVAEVRMKDLPSRAIVYASSPRLGVLTFDSRGERSEALAAFAARCSASIPYFFVPQLVDGQRVYDGGLRENFPLDKFLQENAGKPTIGLYLTSSATPSRWVIADIIDTMTTGNDPDTLRRHSDSIVPIDPRPIRTTDFDLTPDDQRLLVSAGRSAAQRFLLTQNLTGGLTLATVSATEAETKLLRLQVAKRRKRELG